MSTIPLHLLEEALEVLGEAQESPDDPIRAVQDRYEQVARMKAVGKSNNHVAEQLGLTPARVSIILASPFVQKKLKELRGLLDSGVAGVAETLTALQAPALSVLTDILGKTSDEKLATKIALEIMDRGGNGPVQRSLQVRATHPLSEEEWEAIKNKTNSV